MVRPTKKLLFNAPKRLNNEASSHVSKLALILGLIFLLLGLGGVIGSWGAYLTDTAIERSGPRATGHLIKKLFLAAADGDSDYMLEYKFETASGQTVTASRGVSKALWMSLREGETLEVRYSASNPARNFPAGGGVTSIGVTLFISVIASIFAIFGGALVWSFFRHDQTQAP